MKQGIPSFRDFIIRDPRYFLILYHASISWIPHYFIILKKKTRTLQSTNVSGQNLELKIWGVETKVGFTNEKTQNKKVYDNLFIWTDA